jgi:hypothetical protein
MGDDGDRAGGVVQDGLADRAEKQAGEAAVAAGADHDELVRASMRALRALAWRSSRRTVTSGYLSCQPASASARRRVSSASISVGS